MYSFPFSALYQTLLYRRETWVNKATQQRVEKLGLEKCSTYTGHAKGRGPDSHLGCHPKENLLTGLSCPSLEEMS